MHSNHAFSHQAISPEKNMKARQGYTYPVSSWLKQPAYQRPSFPPCSIPPENYLHDQSKMQVYKNSFHIYLFTVYVWGCTHATVCMWRSEGDLWASGTELGSSGLVVSVLTH